METNLHWVARAIDCGIIYGQARDNQFEFRTPPEAVEGRRRLGIRRGFISSLTAETLSLLESAEEIAAFCRSEAASGRFFPAFTIHPNGLFSNGAEATLAAIIRNSPPCIFKLCVNGREDFLRLGIRFLVEQIIDRPIVVSISTKEAPTLGSLVEIARRHPQICIVLTEHHWAMDSFVHAAMEEAENILTDTALGHTNDHIELFVSRYGASRVILSLGYRALGGASLGSVLRARISPEEKEAILFGNITGLLGLPEFDANTAPEIEQGEWKFFLETGAPSFPIIDCHGHFGPVATWPVRDGNEAVQIPRKRAELECQNLRHFIFSHTRALFGDPVEGNAIAERQVLEADDPRLLAYFVYNPRYASGLAPYLERLPRSQVFIGFKLLCDYWEVPVNSPEFDPMWEVADRHNLPVLIHTWSGPYNSPAMISPLAERYPNVRFILAHCGGSDDGRKEAEAVAKKHPHVFLEWCGSFFSRKPWEDTVAEIGDRKLLFGTDGVLHGHAWELARLLSVPLGPEAFRSILHDSMMEIISPLLKTRDLRSIF